MSYIKKYLQNARSQAQERFLNVEGFPDMYFAGENDFYNADAGAAAPAAAPSMGAMRTSQPYIITVSNASATTTSNFDVLGAYQYINNTGFSNGTLTLGNCVISSAISNVTYQEFLYQSMNSPFSVGLTYIESISGSASQVTQTLTLNTRDANGNQALKTLVPTIDPYQQQSSIVALNQLYRIDGYTKLTIASILPSVVFRIHFYPADNINIARGLEGRPASAQYGSPNIIKSSVAVVGGETVRARLG